MKLFLISAAAVLLSGSASAGDVVQVETLTASVMQGDPVSVENVNGNIVVEGWDSPGVQVSYTITCSSQEEMDAISVVCSTENGVSCRVIYNEDWDGDHHGKVDFLINVPSDVDLDYSLENVNGDIDCSNHSGRATIDLVNGEVAVSDLTGEVAISVVNGDVTAGEVPGASSISIVNGSILLSVNEMQGDAVIESVNGGIKLQLDADARVEAETMSGSIHIAESFGAVVSEDIVKTFSSFGNGERLIVLSTINGDIEVMN